MKGLIILADGFEDVEAIGTIDILRRSRIEITTCSLENPMITSAHNIKVIADVILKNVNLKNYDFLVIPGGKAVFEVLDKSCEVEETIRYFVEKERLVATICAAPSQVGKLGYLENREYTCFPGCNDKIVGGKYSPKKGVVITDNFITAKAMGYTNDFALSIIEFLQGKNQRKEIEKSIFGN